MSLSRRGPVNARDVATAAGVSQSAVSRAFTPGASVAPATRERVLNAARDLGYRPNMIARSLVSRRSRIIGVAVGHLGNGFYPAVLEALSGRLQALGYHVLLFTAPARGDADPGLQEIMRYQLDGLILLSATLSSRLAAECRAGGVPVVLFNRVTPDEGVESVAGENEAGARRIARFLLAGGHRRFAYVAGLADSSTNRDREAGFGDALRAARRPAPVRLAGDYDAARAGEAAAALFARPDRPDAVFCASDHMALAVMDAARRGGLRVPEDVSVIGFDDSPPASLGAYDLTTYAQPVAPMVEETVRLLATRLDDPALPARHAVVPGALVVRGSARLPAPGALRGLVRDGDRTIWHDPEETR